MKTILVAGATGNTGRPLVEQLLGLGHTYFSEQLFILEFEI